MISKSITFNDYNGTERTETFHFNLNEAELMEMQMSTSGGLAEHIERMISEQDAPSIMRFFKELILKSYGVKSPDGKRFIKSEEISKEFEQTEAYSQLFMELATDADAASHFVNEVIPKKLRQQASVALERK